MLPASSPMDSRSLEPALGTPPGSPASTRDKSEKLRAFPTVKKHMLDDTTTGSPRESRTASTDTIDSGRAGEERPKRDVQREDDDDFDDIALDAGVGVVTKSIYKEKRGFLSRLRDASSSVKSKYTPSDTTNHAVLPANVRQLKNASAAFMKEEEGQVHRRTENTSANVEIVLEEDESIQVAIDQTSQQPQRNVHYGDQNRRRDEGLSNEVATGDHDVGPQVVIHSTESDSDSGFATLNPVINRSGRGKRGSAIASSTIAGSSPPVLLSLPIVEEPTDSNERLLLIIHALGATGLAKVEKFGTQSTLLELRVCESTEQISSGAAHLSYLRTAVHKKGGSEAQWNQQFTTGLQSKARQQLHIAVRTHSKLLVGEAMVSLVSVTDELYDQHFIIYRTGNDGSKEAAGQVHLQLRVMEPSNVQSTNALFAIAKSMTSRVEIPPVLRNGALMFKIPYHAHALIGSMSSKRQWIAVSYGKQANDVFITWCDPIDTTEKSRRLDVSHITEIREGARTKAFERLLQNEPGSVAKEQDRCFSVVSKTRTLDLVAASKDEAMVWVYGLRQLVFGVRDPSVVTSSVRTIEDFGHSALVPRDALDASSTTAKKHQLLQWRSYVFDFARQGEIDSISTCLHEGCPIDLLETGTGDTLLMLACRLGNTKLVELCLHWRAKNDPHPEFGETALQVAVNAGHSECIRLILLTAAKSDMDSVIVNHIDSSNNAPLHVAARKGDLACMQLLLHHGADICVVEEFGRTPLHCAAVSGSLDCVAYLLDVGGDSVLNAGDHDGDTALHYAALAGEDSIVKLFLESAADIQSTNIHGETALDLARREHHTKCERLIAKYVHTNSVETTHLAARNEIASSLLLTRQKDEATDGMEESEEDFIDDDPETYVDPSNSPIRRGPIERDEICDFQVASNGGTDYFVPHSSHCAPPMIRNQTISPSARVREVLASHRERLLMYRSSPIPPLQFHSAGDNIYGPYPLDRAYIPPRLAVTERFEREHSRSRGFSHPRYGHRDIMAHCLYDAYAPEPSYEDHRYLARGRSMSAMRAPANLPHGNHVYEDGCQPQSHHQYIHNHDWRANSNYVTSTQQNEHWREVYQRRTELASNPSTSTKSSIPCIWDTYYSDEGYPYYVNRSTGESRWENPFEAVTHPLPLPVPSDSAAENYLSSEDLSKQMPTEIGTGKRPISTPNVNAPSQAILMKDGHSIALAPAHEVSEATPSRDDAKTLSLPPSSSPGSKYAARTGLSLSVDVSSPQRQDDRPVYIPSPRSCSPRKTANGREPETTDDAFGKSPRASSPRGKSKNVQIIDLKRANNLAMALASFKINDRNEQIIQAVSTLNEKVVNAELLLCLQRFFPTNEEAASLRSYGGALKSLGPADRFFYQLLQIPEVTQRIECFLYKLQFARSYRIAYSRIQVIKRACRDLVENYSFVQALSDFFEKANAKSLQTLTVDASKFRMEFLPRIDEKLHTFHEDLQKASEIELLEVQLRVNRLITGIRPVQGFVERTSPPEDRDIAAHDVLQRFLSETRGKLTDLESEYESLGQWENKVLGLFGESKATCQLTPILECVCSILDNASC